VRIRNIKPAFFKNEELGKLDPYTRLLFIGLWTLADSEGKLEDRPARIMAEIFPYDMKNLEDPEGMLDGLAKAGFIARYVVEGQKILLVKTFHKHQALSGSERGKKSEFPDEISTDSGKINTSLTLPATDSGRKLLADIGHRTTDNGVSSPPARASGDLPEPWSSWVGRIKGAHPCCGKISPDRIVQVIRIYRPDDRHDRAIDKAVGAYECHMSGAASHANPLQKFENYLRKMAEDFGTAEKDGGDEPPAPPTYKPKFGGKKEGLAALGGLRSAAPVEGGGG